MTTRKWFRLQRRALWATGDRQALELILLGCAVADRDPIARDIVAWLIARTPFRYTDLHRTSTWEHYARDITQ